MNQLEPTSRDCARCGQHKSLDQFHRQRSGKHGRHCWCKACANSAQKSSRVRHLTPERSRRWNLSRRYGLTERDFDERMQEQGHVCAICQRPMQRPVVDHCHKTGIVRGILCHGCNIKLPAINDADFLNRAMAYLAKSK